MRFQAYFKSESSDDYFFTFDAKKMPHTDAEWLPILRKHASGDVPEELNGPGCAGTYLHFRYCRPERRSE